MAKKVRCSDIPTASYYSEKLIGHPHPEQSIHGFIASFSSVIRHPLFDSGAWLKWQHAKRWSRSEFRDCSPAFAPRPSALAGTSWAAGGVLESTLCFGCWGGAPEILAVTVLEFLSGTMSSDFNFFTPY
jgi:hypothetical protein